MSAPHKKSSFSPAFFFLKKEKRQALSALYAFCRAVDDAVDNPVNTDPKKNLQNWRNEIQKIYSGNPSSKIGNALVEPVKKFKLKKEYFLLIIEGVEKDIYISRYETFNELEKYLYRVASAVGLLCIDIFGYKHESAKDYAKWLGYAVQLTNIIRDINQDAKLDRIYIPLEDLQRFGCTEKDILNNKLSSNLIKFEISRARSFYAKAYAALDDEDKKNMFPAQIMACVYEAILSKINKLGFVNCEKKIKLNAIEKICCIFKAWRLT